MRLSPAIAAAVAVTGFACANTTPGPRGPAPAAPPSDPRAVPVPVDPAPTDPLASPLATSTSRPGVGHTSAIDRVVLSPGGQSALTTDGFGGVRLWTALDGSAEPRALPVRGLLHLSLSEAGDGRWVIGVVDSAHAGHVLAATDDGAVRELVATPPFDPLVEIQVLPGGEHVVALGKDHTVRLYDLTGKQLARLERRGFRPTSLLVSADGRRLIALAATPTAAAGGTFEGTVWRIDVDVDAAELSVVGDSVTFTSTLSPASPVVSASPDGKLLAYLTRDPKQDAANWTARVLDLADGSERALPLPLLLHHFDPSIGFVSDRKLIASTMRGSTTWILDLDRPESPRPWASPPASFSAFTAQAVGRGRRVIGFNTFLFVQDVDPAAHRYLGYGPLIPQTVALSPSGDRAAWSTPVGQVVVDSTAGDGERRVVSMPWGSLVGIARLFFVDDDHLLVIDNFGGVRVVRVRDDAVIAEADGGGSIRDAEVDPHQRLLRITRQQNDTWVFRIDSDLQLSAPLIAADQSFRSGLLTAATDTDPVLWTIDAQNQMRVYSLAQLRGDPVRAEPGAGPVGDPNGLGEPAKQARPAPQPVVATQPIALDRRGGRYTLEVTGIHATLTITSDTATRKLRLARSTVSTVVTSPDGALVVVGYQDGGVEAYDAATGKPRWSTSTGVAVTLVVVADDGSQVALAAQNGGVVIDAVTGETSHRRCTLAFEVRRTPPPTHFGVMNTASACEL